MVSLKIPRVVFAGQELDIIGMIERPKAWPSFRFFSYSLSTLIQKIPFWRLCVEEKRCNKGAFLIAKSVTRDDRRQSYVAAGYPFWLRGLFIHESKS